MNFSILARLQHGVEKGLLLGITLGLACGSAIPAHSARAAVLDEPDPWPQVEVPPQSDYYEAKELLAKRKWQEAAIVLRAVLKKDPDFAPASVELSRALAYSGRREEALGVLSVATSREKGVRKAALIRRSRVLSRMFLTDKTFQLHQDGVNLMYDHRYRPARERFEKALEQEPDNAEILTRLAQCMVLDNDSDSAAERLRLAKRLDPYDPEIRLWLGRALSLRGELGPAIEELKFANSEMEGSELAPLWLAEALSAQGQRAAAISVLEEDTQSQPFHVAALVALARYRETRDEFLSAKKDLQLALSRLPKYPDPSHGLDEGELGLDLAPSTPALKDEIERILHEVEGRLNAERSA